MSSQEDLQSVQTSIYSSLRLDSIMRIWRTPEWQEGKSSFALQVIRLLRKLNSSSWSQLLDKETDWNIVSNKGAGILDRQVKLSRGKYLGGCSGCNGTLCVRGAKQDFDDWGLEGWSGDEFFGYMKKVNGPSIRHQFLVGQD